MRAGSQSSANRPFLGFYLLRRQLQQNNGFRGRVTFNYLSQASDSSLLTRPALDQKNKKNKKNQDLGNVDLLSLLSLAALRELVAVKMQGPNLEGFPNPGPRASRTNKCWGIGGRHTSKAGRCVDTFHCYWSDMLGTENTHKSLSVRRDQGTILG